MDFFKKLTTPYDAKGVLSTLLFGMVSMLFLLAGVVLVSVEPFLLGRRKITFINVVKMIFNDVGPYYLLYVGSRSLVSIGVATFNN